MFVRAALDRLVQRYEQALRAQGSTIIPEDRPDLLSDLLHDAEVRRQLNLAWLPYTPQGFLRILLSRADRLRAAGVLVDIEIYRGVTHEFIKMGRALPEARQFHQDAGRALRQAFGTD